MSRFFSVFLTFAAVSAFSQSPYIPLNEAYYHGIDRYEVKTGRILPQLFTTIKPYKRSQAVEFLSAADSSGFMDSNSDMFNLDYFMNDSWEWSEAETSDSQKPVFGKFYRKRSDLYHVEEPEFDLHVNPVIYFAGGKDNRLDDTYFINTRGVEVRGMIDRKLGFYTYLTDNQMLLPSYVGDGMRGDLVLGVPGTGVVPHEGFWKTYKYGSGVDFLQARGYITFEATKHINLQFGHDRFFIGNGYRSLIFSDNGPPALFLKMNAKVWKINYMFFLNKMYADRKLVPNKYPEKYVAMHHLSMNIGKKLNVGIFESVVFSPSDTATFEWSYLNPIIFYRGIEQQGGSSDNVIIGADFKWNALKGIQLYGQFVLDEFVIDHIRKGDGWWANKFGVQLGAKYIDAFGVSNLDLQGELNLVRPYTYSHYTDYGSYTNFRQPIGHPLGANFKEMVGIVRYQPLPKLNLVGKLIYAQVGRDTLYSNWGGNIFLPNSSREMEFDNKVAQGAKNDITMMSFTASWQLKHNVFIDFSTVVRRGVSDVAFYNTNSTLTSVALRINIPQRLYEF